MIGAPGIVGRRHERERLARTIEAATNGTSAVAVLRGPAGIGKTTLLDELVVAPEATVLRARAVETESELPFATLHALLRPLLARLEELPPRQAEALAAALALGPPDLASDRFSVYAATLGLLALAAEERPVLAVVDDADWLDAASAEALAFAGRRLDADGVALVFALRSVPPALAGAAFDDVVLGPLTPAELEAVLAARLSDLAPAVAARVARAADGNPLAALEIAGRLTPEVRRGESPLPDPLPGSSSVEQALLERIERIDPDGRTALLAAACCEDGDLGVVVRALAGLDVAPEALAAPEAAGLVELTGEQASFGQPAVRTAVLRSAVAVDRRAMHRALADALDAPRDVDRRAWHLAAAAIGPDEEVARALETTAGHAAARRGHAAAERAYARAAELSTDPEERARRLCVAAGEAALAGRPAAGLTALDGAAAATEDDARRAEIRRLRGRIAARGGSAGEATALLEAEGDRLAASDPEAAAALLAEAVLPCLRANRPRAALGLARRAHALAGPPRTPAGALAAAALATALIFTGEVAEGRRVLLEVADGPAARADEPYLRLQLAAALRFAGEHERARAALQGLVDEARSANAPGVLPYALARLGGLELEVGRFRVAAASLYEAERLARATGQLGDLGLALGARAWLDAVHGDDDRAREATAEALGVARALGGGSVLDHVTAAQGLLALGRGRPDDAVTALAEPVRRQWEDGWSDAAVPPHPAPDLAEALFRTGETGAAEETIERFEADAARAGRPLAQALALRVRGLLAPADAFDEPFAAALAAHEGHAGAFERARTQLLYGERLRRAGRRVDCRTQLRAATAVFQELDARPWAERAAEELRASGETVRRRGDEPTALLTPQELQVAQVVAGGASNREAAARLFLSPKTVEFHLSRVFRKLGVRSRVEMLRALAEHEQPP